MAPTTSNSSFTAEGDYACLNGLPSPSPGDKLFLINLGAEDIANTLALKFYGRDAADESGSIRVWGMAVAGNDPDWIYMGDYLFDADIILGTAKPEEGLDSIFSPDEEDTRFADTITITNEAVDTPPGLRLYGDVENGVAVLLFDTTGFRYILVEFKRDTASHLGLLWRTL